VKPLAHVDDLAPLPRPVLAGHAFGSRPPSTTLGSGCATRKESCSIEESTSARQANSSTEQSKRLMTSEPTRQERPIPPGNSSGEPTAPKAARTWRGGFIDRELTRG
jgi:hypothetical protein